MHKYLFYFLFLLNIFYLFFFNRKTIRKFFYKPKIKSLQLEKIDDLFLPETIDKKLKAPSQNMLINTFFVPASWNVVGMTSDYEAWILSVISKKSQSIFEFGTCSGKTTFLFALNSPEDARVVTITLDPGKADEKILVTGDNVSAKKNALSESIYNNFMFSLNSKLKEKIDVIFQDSKKLNIDKYKNSFDLIFIDGGHTYSCIKNDTEKAMQMIKKNGFIFWHDYSVGKRSHKDVYKYLNEICDKYKIFHIQNTTLCFYKRQ